MNRIMEVMMNRTETRYILDSSRKLLDTIDYKAGGDMHYSMKTLMLGREECWRNLGVN